MRTTPKLRCDARETLGADPPARRGVVVEGMNLESALLYDLEEALSSLREVTNRLKLVMPCPGCSSHIAGDDEHVLGCTVAQVLDKARAVLESHN